MSTAVAQDEWQRALEKNGLTAAYMNSEATGKLFAQQAVQLRDVLTELGLVK